MKLETITPKELYDRMEADPELEVEIDAVSEEGIELKLTKAGKRRWYALRPNKEQQNRPS